MVPIKTSFCFRFNLFPSHLINLYLRNCSSLTLDEIKALIPKKIERGPTDILKALSQTCKRDFTAYDYKFMDDPYFYPMTNLGKITHSLSLESGRKSARWIVKEYPQLFDHKVSEPFIKALAPQIEYNENSDVAEETLVKVVHERNVSDAIFIYNLLKKKGVDISNDTKQMLLELVCFFNCEKLYDEKDFESNWHADTRIQNLQKTWKDEGFAEELFNDINLDCSLAYSTLIQGMLKYGQLEKALSLLKKGQEKNLKFTVWVYNGLIENACTIYQNNDQRWNYVVELLHEMKKNQVTPNLYTLNCIMKLLFTMNAYNRRNYRSVMKTAFQVLSEFRKIGITPSLGTHYYALEIMCCYRILNDESHKFFKNTLKQIGEKKLDFQHPDDKHFFLSAMRICEKLKDVESAHFLVDLLLKNTNLVGGNIKERILYEKYFNILLENEPFEYFIEIYQKLIPTVYNFDDSLYMKTLEVIKKNEAFDFLPIIWNDLENFVSEAKLIRFAPHILNMAEAWVATNEEVSAIFEKATKICTFCLESENAFGFPENIASGLLITFLKLNKFDDAVNLFKKVSEKTLINFNYNFNFKAIEHFYDFLITNDKKDYILPCLTFAKNMDHPHIKEMAEKALVYLKEDDSNFEWVKKLTKDPEIKSKEEEEKKNVKPELETEKST